MSQLANQWIDLFRAGDYGEKGSYTEQDLQQIVDRYNPSFHEAPACIGHPEHDAPAYGWFEQLRRVGKVLQGKLKPDVDPTFEEMVKSRRFSKRSVSLYHDDAGLSLRHVAFLGAQPPECKGLADIKFDQKDKQSIVIDFAEETAMPDTPEQQQHRTIIDTLNAWWNARFGSAAPAAGATFSEADVRRMAAEAATAAAAPLQAQLDAQKQTFSDTQTAQQKIDAKSRADAAVLRLKSAGVWVPAFDRMGIPHLFAELAKQTQTIEFGEGDARKTQTMLETLTTFMEGLQKIVPSAPVYTGQSTARPASAKSFPINDSPRARVDPNSIAFAEKVRERVRDKSIDWGTAMSQVAAEHPELTQPGGASEGQV